MMTEAFQEIEPQQQRTPQVGHTPTALSSDLAQIAEDTEQSSGPEGSHNTDVDATETEPEAAPEIAESELSFRTAKVEPRSWKAFLYGSDKENEVFARGKSGASTAPSESIWHREEEGLFIPAVPSGSSKKMRDEILEASGKASAISWSHTTAPVALQRFGPSKKTDTVSRPIRKFVPNSHHLKVYHSNPQKVIDGSIGDQSYQLDVKVGHLELSCHPLMTREIYLTAQLKRDYRDYKRKERANLADFYNRKIITLEENILGARDAALGGWEDRLPQENASSLSNLKQLELSLIDAKQKRSQEEEEVESILQKMIDTYEKLSFARTEQGFQSTNTELQIVEEASDLTHAETRLRLDSRLFAAEQEDIIGLDAYSTLPGISFRMQKVDCTAISYLNRKDQHMFELKELKNALSNEAQRPLSRAERNDIERRAIVVEQKLVELGDFPQRARVSDQLVEERVKVAEAQARKVYDALHSGSRQKVILFARESEDSRKQMQRKLTFDIKSMQKLKLSARLLINDKEVGQTDERAMNPDFAIDFDWSFSVQLYRWPEKARLQIYERQSILQSKHLISEIKLGVPMGEGGNLEDVHPLSYDFAATVPFTPNWSVNTQPLYAAGEAFVHSKWVKTMDLLSSSREDLEQGMVDSSINPLAQRIAPTTPQYVTETMSRSLDFKHGIKNNKAKLREWLKSNKIDPNDPKNFDFIYLIDADMDRFDTSDDGGVYSVALPDDLKLELDPLVGRKRQVLLRSRWDKKLPALNESSSGLPIPLHERAIAMPTTMVNQDTATRDKSLSQRRFQASKIATSSEALEIIDRRNTKIHKFLVKTKKKIVMAKLATQKMKEVRLEDTVKEVILPEIKLDLRFLKKLFAPNRKLRPTRRALKNIAIAPDSVEIVVGIEKGMHLPVRTQEETIEEVQNATPGKSSKMKITMKAPADHKLLRPYIEVVFQGKRSHSHISEGTNPIWNHEARFPFSSVSGKITPSELLKCKDKVTFNIFDISDEALDEESDVVVPESEREKKAPGTFLGTTSVSVSSIYRGRICQGNFILEVPIVLLGYDQAIQNSSLSIYCTLQPAISPPEESKTALLSMESVDIMSQSERWIEYLKTFRQCKYRDFKPLVPNSENVLNLVTRYVSPLALPPSYSAKSTVDMLRVARLVSLIPHVESLDEFEEISDIWLGCDDFLAMCAGDGKAHAVTLCNFFLKFGHNAYVVTGKSHGRAQAYFVMTTSTPEGEEAETSSKKIRFWSPYTGKFYTSEDSGNELVSVFMIFNSKNIWANVQSHDEPWYLEWDTESTSDWIPFFSASFPGKDLATNQKVPRYFKFKSVFFIELESSIEREVMNAITSARTYEYTHFNRRCSRMMKSLLQDLSQADMRGSISNEDLASIKKRHDEELSSIERMYGIRGQPLCFPLTYMSEMQQSILNTGIHNDYRNDVEMAVAVHVQYSEVNYICAIWIYVARLKKLWK